MKIMSFPLMVCWLSLFFSACSMIHPTRELASDFTVHKVFGDQMVLQRDRIIRISGTCRAGQGVHVALAEKTASAFADQQGRWEAQLPPMPAGGPYLLKISGAGGHTVEFKDVLIGEVWLCSGQSNMAMPLWSNTLFWRSENGDQEAANANFPQLRLYNANLCNSVAPKGPVAEIAGPGWTACNAQSAAAFSAAGYYFAKQLQLDLGIPIGIINSSWGGTPIQSWISREGYQKNKQREELHQIDSFQAKNIDQIYAEKRKQIVEWEEQFLRQNPGKSGFAEGFSTPDWDDSLWLKRELPAPVTPNLPGVFWYRREIQVPAGWSGYDLELGLGAIDEADETYFNGKLVGQTGTDEPQYWLKKRVYKITAEHVKAGNSNVIAVRILNFEGATGMEGPTAAMFLKPYGDENTRLCLAGEWKYQVEFNANAQLYPAKPRLAPDPTSPHFPATLFNSMIAPWTKFAIRGALWYQGESNASRYPDYFQLQKILIEDWRQQWKDPEFAFVLTQLAAFQTHNPTNPLAKDFWENQQPGENDWSWLREAQRAALKLPNTGMAVSIDIGNPSDIHPVDKKTLGFRLAREAQRICYGYQGVSAGPLYKKMKREGNKIRLFFANTGSGLLTHGEELHSFAIAGKDKHYYWAEAKIDGNTVLVCADAVPEPLSVRYAWAMYPGNANLYNTEGFPASPFQTETPDWLP
ncbi:MAG: sialate O-acetylesterase [Lentisphaeria bacterium]